ncbi:unnamed protein product [Enterobius vermicularis]|uniref:GHMP_kinases_N domain-containing protein n=1 Tax=Enterobius vermicularis TaxID=51028 RepID=A0A0N4VA95_ENTVE|nr:unnamed protein product [Enterobius vermicularis]
MHELEWLQCCGALNTEQLLVIDDPFENLGSGGSSLNALLSGGRDYPFNRCGSAFLWLGTDLVTTTGYRVPYTVFLHQIAELNRLVSNFGNGVWITGGDAFWSFGKLQIPETYKDKTGALFAFTFKANPRLSKNSGVYCINEDMKITGIDYCTDRYTDTNDVPLVMTLLFMPVRTAETFLSLYTKYPLSSSTYYGVDNGSPGLKLSIFFDFVLAAAEGMKKDSFVYEEGKNLEAEPNSRFIQAKEVLYDTFSHITAYAVFLDVLKYHYFQPPTIKNVIEFWQLWNGREPKNMDEIENQLHLPGLTTSVGSEVPLESCFRFNRMKLFQRWYTVIGDVIRRGEHCSVQPYLKSICISQDSSSAFALIQYLHTLCLEKNGILFADRALFCIAEVLALLARQRGGLRSGPAGNIAFANCIQHIHDVISLNVVALVFSSPRHYEAAGQVLIQRNVMKFCLKHLPSIPKGQGVNSNVVVSSACRIDVAGGWTDTPPITMQVAHTAVVNIAVTVDGKKPISCEIRPSATQVGIILKELDLRLTAIDEILNLSSKPSLPGSLICAVLLAAQFIKRDDQNISTTFQRTFGDRIKGLIVTTRSLLPHGSGLGTSSILAACLIAGIWKLMGVHFNTDNICHAVLLAEQYLTAGGGWQDQVGGVIPGIKISRFSKEKQSVVTEKIPCESSFVSMITRRLVLIYTGQTRLAKNVLQEVIRSWYANDERLTSVLESLANAAENSAKLFAKSSFPLNDVRQYYADKKAIASTCEPAFVRRLIEDLNESRLIECAWLAGAGGGGFLNVWLSEGHDIDDVRQHLQSSVVYSGLSVHSIEVDFEPFKIAFRET